MDIICTMWRRFSSVDFTMASTSICVACSLSFRESRRSPRRIRTERLRTTLSHSCFSIDAHGGW